MSFQLPHCVRFFFRDDVFKSKQNQRTRVIPSLSRVINYDFARFYFGYPDGFMFDQDNISFPGKTYTSNIRH